MSIGKRWTQDEFIKDWAIKANWPAKEWDYTEWDECLLSWKAYKKSLDNQE